MRKITIYLKHRAPSLYQTDKGSVVTRLMWSVSLWFTLLLCSSQGHETSALLILEKMSDRNFINCTNTALQTYVEPSWCTLTAGKICEAQFGLSVTLPSTCRPLHVAAKNGLTVVVQELLGKGASVLAVDENGQLSSHCIHLHYSGLILVCKMNSVLSPSSFYSQVTLQLWLVLPIGM